MTQDTAIMLREWALVVPTLLVLLLPGFGFAYTFASRVRLSWPWVFTLAFSWGVAWCAILSIASFYAGLSLSVVVAGMIAVVPVSAYLSWDTWQRERTLRRRRLEGHRPYVPMRPCFGGLGMALAALVISTVQGAPWFGTPDSYFHIGATRSLLAMNRPIVTDPLFGTASRVPDSTAGMWNTVMAVVSRIFDVDAATVYPALTATAAFLVVLAFWTLAYEAGRSRSAATWASAAYMVFAWYGDFRAFAYPNKVSIALAFAAIALMLRLATRPDRRFVVVAGITGFSALAVHLASGELVLLCGGAMAMVLALAALLKRDHEAGRRSWHGAIAIAAALALAVLIELPTLYPRIAALKGSTVLGEDSFIWAGNQIMDTALGIRIVAPGGFDFGGPLLFLLTFLVGVLAVIAFAKGDSPRTAAVLPLLGMAHVLTVFPLVSTLALDFSSYMVARMVELLRFSPYIGVAWTLGRVPSRLGRLSRLMGVALLVAALLSQWPYLASTYVQGAGSERRGVHFSIPKAARLDVRKSFGFEAIWEMREIFGDDYPVVIAEPTSGYYLNGLADCVVVASLPTHTPVFMPRDEVQARFNFMLWFFNENAEDEYRSRMLDKFDAEYVFVWKVLSGVVVTRQIQAMPELELLVETDDVLLLKVVR